MRTSTWIAIGLFAAAVTWFASGLVIGGGEEGKKDAAAQPPQPTLVEVQPSTAERVPQYIYAQGVAQPYRTADVISPTGGTLDEVLVKEGDVVEAGAVLARVRLDERESQLRSAEARVESLEADFEGLRELEGQGYATEARVRDLEAQLKEARAALQSVRDEIRDTTIEAPIPGIVNDVFANAGETLGAGAAVLRIVDNSPLRATLYISQHDIGRVDMGRVATVSFATGDLTKGRVCFVAPAADPETRTFRVEIRVPNEKREIPSVVSVEVRFQTGEAEAHFISPAIFALNEDGTLGVKSADEGGTVRFHKVELTRATIDGIWVSGLPDQVQLITTGQGFVREGERVRVRVSKPKGKENGTANTAAQDVRPPTATIEAEDFDQAEDLPEPPPADVLCKGSAANRVSTSSAPTGSTGGAGGGASTQGSGASSSTGGTTGTQGSSQGMPDSSGTQQGTGAGQSIPTAPSVEVTPPRISVPSLAQPPSQAPGTTQGQGSTTPGGGAAPGSGTAAPPTGSGSSPAGSAPGGGAQGGAQ